MSLYDDMVGELNKLAGGEQITNYVSENPTMTPYRDIYNKTVGLSKLPQTTSPGRLRKENITTAEQQSQAVMMALLSKMQLGKAKAAADMTVTYANHNKGMRQVIGTINGAIAGDNRSGANFGMRQVLTTEAADTYVSELLDGFNVKID